MITVTAVQGTWAWASTWWKDGSPFYDRSRWLAQMLQTGEDVSARVVGLLDSCRPSAVLRGIWAVIVNSVYRVAVTRPATHIRDKRIERVCPSVAHVYASSAVVHEALVVRVAAPFAHDLPDAVFGNLAHAVSRVGCLHSSRRSLAAIAATASRIGVQQVLCEDVDHSAAGASTGPSDSHAIGPSGGQVWPAPNDRESFECSTSQVVLEGSAHV